MTEYITVLLIGDKHEGLAIGETQKRVHHRGATLLVTPQELNSFGDKFKVLTNSVPPKESFDITSIDSMKVNDVIALVDDKKEDPEPLLTYEMANKNRTTLVRRLNKRVREKNE